MVIWLIEGNPDTVALIRETLGPDVRVCDFPQGDEGADWFLFSRFSRPVLLIAGDSADACGPEEVAARIRAAMDKTPILALSAHADELRRARAIRAGVTAYLTKPFHPADLLAKVRELLTPPIVPNMMPA